MTKNDLIEIIKDCPGDMDVMLLNDDLEQYDCSKVDIRTIIENGERREMIVLD